MKKDKRFNPPIDNPDDLDVTSLLCMPIRNSEHETIAVVQLFNKIRNESTSPPDIVAPTADAFDVRDIRVCL
jgi:hypothetical protein